MSQRRPLVWVRAAAIATLAALALMVWSFVDPQPLAMMVFMTAGQALGTLSLILYVAAVAWELIGSRARPTGPPLEGGGRGERALGGAGLDDDPGGSPEEEAR